MKSDWLAASNFERTHEVVSAINTLSIHAKLARAGVDDSDNSAEVLKARSCLLAFLDRFQTLLQDTERGNNGTVIGADPRMGELALRFLAERQRLPRRSRLYDVSLTQLRGLVQSEKTEDLAALISCLRGLRELVEQNSHADIVGILGDA